MADRNGDGHIGLNRRLTALEKRVGMDDVIPGSITERLNAQHRMIQAISETQSEHTRTLAEHTRTLAEHSRILAEHGVILGKLLWGMTEIKNLLKPGGEGDPSQPAASP